MSWRCWMCAGWLTLSLQAGLLPATDWRVTGPQGEDSRAAVDGDPATAWTSAQPQRPGMAVTIDLGRPLVLHRFYLTPGDTPWLGPLQVRLLVGATAETLTEVWSADTARDRDLNVRLAPVVARVVRWELLDGAALPWRIAELELYGGAAPERFGHGDAIVVDFPLTDKPFDSASPTRTLALAARELQYYLGELTGEPLPIVGPDETAPFAGTLYELRRPVPGLPEQVNVEREGRTVRFRAWPYANVLCSVYEFLERQGVRWVYPDAHGDFVPAGRGVDLGLLPLRYAPTSSRRFANFGIAPVGGASAEDAFLYYIRQRYNSTWGNRTALALGGGEVPADPQAPPVLKGEGFGGYPHNGCLVTDADLLAHPEFRGMYTAESWRGKRPLQQRLAPAKGGPQFCMSAPGVAELVAGKILAAAAGNRRVTGTVNLLPWDSVVYCECPACQALQGPPQPELLSFACSVPVDHGEIYYTFVKRVAERIAAELPGVRLYALAYADNHRPPSFKLPDNVIVEVCQYGARNLPMEALANAEMKQRMLDWRERAATLRTYEYLLIHTERDDFALPVPLVTAMASRARFLHQLGAFEGGTQACNVRRYIPWNHYAYPRLLWDVHRPAEHLLDDFFGGYFQEAAAPMRRYYDVFERHLIAHEINLHFFMYDYAYQPGALPPAVEREMAAALDEAEAAARYWVVKQRVADMRHGFVYTLAQRARYDALAPSQP